MDLASSTVLYVTKNKNKKNYWPKAKGNSVLCIELYTEVTVDIAELGRVSYGLIEFFFFFFLTV